MPPFPPRPLIISYHPGVHNICVLVRFSFLSFNFLIDLVFLCPLAFCSAGVLTIRLVRDEVYGGEARE